MFITPPSLTYRFTALFFIIIRYYNRQGFLLKTNYAPRRFMEDVTNYQKIWLRLVVPQERPFLRFIGQSFIRTMTHGFTHIGRLNKGQLGEGK